MAKTNLRLVAPDSELRTVTLRRRSNRDMGRDREHLTELEVERLIKVAKGNRHGHRDATMILIGFRHGLRVSELCDLQWSSIAFETGTMHVRRAKGGESATHPLLGDELRALRELKRQSASPFVFASERGGPFTPSGFAKLLARAGDEAKIGFQGPPSHAQACLRLRTGQQGHRYSNPAGLPRPPFDQLHHALCRVGARSVQKHLGLRRAGRGKSTQVGAQCISNTLGSPGLPGSMSQSRIFSFASGCAPELSGQRPAAPKPAVGSAGRH
jgi:integrase